MDDQIHPVINVEESIGKIVGKRTAAPRGLNAAGNSKSAVRAWQEAFPAGGIPKGVYKFNSHEEADEWLIKAMARAAAKRI